MGDLRKAAIAVAGRATNPADCRRLLDMLGLLAELRPAPAAAPTTTRRPNRKGGHGRPPVDRGHGDYRTYIKGCRCDDCREDHRAHHAELRAARAKDPAAADRAGHGKTSTYKNYGCRCAACSKANTANVKAFRARRRARLSEVQS
ncbi:hypothetical protein [Streptomyces sp. NPDC096153]|uniref:hypothetical protein n=1 Tax=Streptomyces sp. NPDC096153 TaxID=3155548 RepID=UPI003330D483